MSVMETAASIRIDEADATEAKPRFETPREKNKEVEMKPSRAYRAKRSVEIDLEYDSVLVEEGKTYSDDGTTIFDVYASDASLFEPTPFGPGTTIFKYPHGR